MITATQGLDFKAVVNKEDISADESTLETDIQSESSTSSAGLEEDVFECDKCPRVFKLKTKLAHHRKHHKKSKSFRCDLCDKSYTKTDHLKRHRKIHDAFDQAKNSGSKEVEADMKPRKGLIQCSQCPKLFRFQEKFEIHQKLHSGIRPFSCDLCNKTYKKMDHLNRHKKTHSGDKSILKCTTEGCDKTFSRMESLQSHLKIKHSGQPEKREMCDECGKSFVNASYLRTHKLSHLGSEHYPFECEHCAKKFLYKKTMDEHVLRVHTDIRNFVCQICGAKKATKNSLRAHVNTHTRERLYKCKECPKEFASSANLAIHTNCVHKKIKKHKCQYCGYAFSRLLTCKLHERTHTGEKPHACGVCGKTFAQSTARNTHEKIHNK